MQVGWIFTDLVSEDTRKGTVRYSRNKVRWGGDVCLAGPCYRPALGRTLGYPRTAYVFRTHHFQHIVLGKLRLSLFICVGNQNPPYLYKALPFIGQPMRWIALCFWPYWLQVVLCEGLVTGSVGACFTVVCDVSQFSSYCFLKKK